jgi:hypothetical protein
MMIFLNLVDDPVISGVCIGLSLIFAIAISIWISIKKKEK